MTRLPIIKLCTRYVYRDARSSQLRAIDNPHDSLEFTDLVALAGPHKAVEIGQMPDMSPADDVLTAAANPHARPRFSLREDLLEHIGHPHPRRVPRGRRRSRTRQI